MTDQQIENWRKIIFGMLERKQEGAGAYALIMPKEEIIKFRDKFQAETDELAKKEEHKQSGE